MVKLLHCGRASRVFERLAQLKKRSLKLPRTDAHLLGAGVGSVDPCPPGADAGPGPEPILEGLKVEGSPGVLFLLLPRDDLGDVGVEGHGDDQDVEGDDQPPID